jgi:hypothetical protein
MPPAAGHRRLDTRYLIEFPVQLVHARRSRSLVVQDVSQGGVFIRTDAPPPLLQLVQVHLVLPIGGHALSAHGMTVHVVEEEGIHGRGPGIGVQFYGLDESTRLAWEAFTRHVATHYPESPDQTPLRLARGATPQPLSRRFFRHKSVLELKPASRSELEDIYTQQLSTGRLFVPTQLDLPPGTVVVVHVTHPVDHTPFLIQATVKQRELAPVGLTVTLLGHDARLSAEMLAFVRGTIVFDEETVTPEPGEAGPSRPGST